MEEAFSVDTERTDLAFADNPLHLSIIPDGSSIKNFYHFAQLLTSGRFQKYDYGWFGNFIFYSSFWAPVYNVTNIEVPVVLMSGGQDKLSAPEDVRWISNQLPNVVQDIVLPHYGHLDFSWAMDAYDKVYRRIVKIARTHMK